MCCILSSSANQRVQINDKGRNLLFQFSWSYLELFRGNFSTFGFGFHSHEFSGIKLALYHLHHWRPCSVLSMAEAILFHEDVLTNFCFRANDFRNALRH